MGGGIVRRGYPCQNGTGDGGAYAGGARVRECWGTVPTV